MDILEILNNSLSQEEKSRKAAELTLLNYANDNFQLLLLTLSDILKNEQAELSVRQISGILLKNLISNIIEYKGKWSLLDKEIKSQIKEKIISNLASTQNIIKKTSSMALAGKY